MLQQDKLTWFAQLYQEHVQEETYPYCDHLHTRIHSDMLSFDNKSYTENNTDRVTDRWIGRRGETDEGRDRDRYTDRGR